MNLILFTPSPKTVAYIKPQRTCKSSTLDELRYYVCSPLPERFIWKNNSTATDGKQYPDMEKYSAQPLYFLT